MGIDAQEEKNLLFFLNPTSWGGAFKAPPEQKWQFQHFLLVQLSPKNLTFPINLLGCLPYPFGGSKQPKKGFLYQFCCRRWQFLDHKFDAKITKIDILTLKLIVPDDYQQFWVLDTNCSHFSPKNDPNFGPTDNKNAIETPFSPFQAPKRVWEALS